MHKILIATDAWEPQVNGVVRTMQTTILELQKIGCDTKTVTPQDFSGIYWPFYKEIKISFANKKKIAKVILEYQPDLVHIVTEGPIGLAVRNYCVKNNIKFTTSYHTKFPEYLYAMFGLPHFISYAYFKWFHGKSQRVLVPTLSVLNTLRKRKIKNCTIWDRGVDTNLFKPYPKTCKYEKPILLYVGRVSKEKNIEAFLNLKTIGTKIVVGDGPSLQGYKQKYTEAIFLGSKHGDDLARIYSQADVFVFPSKSDTFGLVLLESLACGVPFAAYPEPGPMHIMQRDEELAKFSCFVHHELQIAVDLALTKSNKDAAYLLAQKFSWQKCASNFYNILRQAHEI